MKIDEVLTEKEQKDADIKKVTAEPYGQNASFDIHEVDPEFFSVKNLKNLASSLCKDIGMKLGPIETWGSDKQLRNNYKNPKINGISVCQFLYKSSLIVHGIDELHKLFIDIFSCQNFDVEQVKKFIEENVPGKIVAIKTYKRL